ncbi:MAG: RnfABCDGE type electron transport complex subunit B [bacterium]|nr:RnfABCDGE type electron transport complex subunit B [bacterium]
MSLNIVFLSVAVLAVLGFILGAGLSYAARVFAVVRDPRIDAVLSELPGANCGACGYPGCSGYAEALVNGSAVLTGCPVSKRETRQRIADIIGQGGTADTITDKQVPTVKCCGDDNKSARLFQYSGLEDCRAASRLYGGPRQCRHGCLGLGTCVNACQFGAITMSSSGLPVIDRDKCTGCGMCIDICPRQVMSMVPEKAGVQVLCNSGEAAKAVRQVCRTGCIKCRKCAKVCPVGAVSFENGPAEIDPGLCTNCGLCIPECPVNCIYGTNLAG